MARSATLADQIVEVIAHHPGCGLDDVVKACPDLTWNQIFLEVDQLSRAGHLRLALIGPGRVVEVSPNAESRTRRSREGPVRRPALERQPQDAQCGRCGGLMVSENDDDFHGWRCILCGERVDPVILAQRQKSESACLRTVHAGR